MIESGLRLRHYPVSTNLLPDSGAGLATSLSSAGEVLIMTCYDEADRQAGTFLLLPPLLADTQIQKLLRWKMRNI